MLDAHLGTIGVWLAFVASLVGIVVSVLGLGTRRPSGDVRLLAPVMLVGGLFAIPLLGPRY